MMSPSAVGLADPIRTEDLGFPMSHSTGDFSMPPRSDYEPPQETSPFDE